MKHKHSRFFLLACASWALTVATVVLGFMAPAHADGTLKLDAPKPDLAPTPPMGWNSWNKFACNVSERLIRQQADAMAASGMKDAGYQYIVIDDCWQKSRDADGNIQADPERFPSGIKALADYVHSKRWGPTVGHLWRTTHDIYDGWESTKDRGNGMTNILDMQAERGGRSAPNAWNDPDMLEVGNGGMTTTEYESHFSLWAMLAAPLIAGNDLSKMDADTRRILTNGDVIAVDQDPLGQQGRRVWQQGELEIWARPLKGGEHAVVLFNRGKAPAEMKVGWDQLDLPAGLTAHVKDLWTKTVSKQVRGSYGGTVAPHGVIMVRITPVL